MDDGGAYDDQLMSESEEPYYIIFLYTAPKYYYDYVIAVVFATTLFLFIY